MTKTVYEKNEELIKLAKAGDLYAEEKLLLTNDKLCYHIAGKFSNTKIGKDDLASLARIGLFKAYKTFDSDKNVKFATYASRIMQNEILMEIRRNKKHKETLSLEHSISTDVDGNELKLLDTISTPEDEFTIEDSMVAQDVFKVFCKYAKDRDIQILKRYIMGEETQKEVADSLNISQSYVARIATSIEKQLKHISEFGTFMKTNPVNPKREGIVMKKVKRYTKADYIYAFKNYPQLSNKEIGYIMGVVPQSVVNYRSEFKKGAYDNLELIDISKDMIIKLDDFIKNREKKTKKSALDISDEIAFTFPKVVEENIVIELSPEEEQKKLKEIRERIGVKSVTSGLVGDNYGKKEENSKNEIIILNNKISLMSTPNEVSSLIYGVYQLLENSPNGCKVKIDLNFEIIKESN